MHSAGKGGIGRTGPQGAIGHGCQEETASGTAAEMLESGLRQDEPK